jgi:hypothetical protein
MTTPKHTILKAMICLALSCLGPSMASAAIIDLELDTEFSGAYSPEGSPPWVTIHIDDEGTAGSAYLTITNTGLINSEFLSTMYLNFDPALDVAALDFTVVEQQGNFKAPNISTGANTWNVAGSGDYDIQLAFQTKKKDRFGVAESIRYLVAGPESMTAQSFNYNSTGGDNGYYKIVAHVQGIERIGDYSGWVGNSVPEPATLATLAIGSAAIVIRRRRKVYATD